MAAKKASKMTMAQAYKAAAPSKSPKPPKPPKDKSSESAETARQSRMKPTFIPETKVDVEALRAQNRAVERAQAELDKQKKKLDEISPKTGDGSSNRAERERQQRMKPQPPTGRKGPRKPKKPKFGPGDGGGFKPLPGYFEV